MVNFNLKIHNLIKSKKGRPTDFYENIFNDPLNLGCIMIAMLFWSFVYNILIWYLEKIFPGEYGVPLPFYFIVMVIQN